MNLIITEKYRIDFKSEYAVLDGCYQVANTHTHHGVITEELPFEDTIDIVRKAIESDAWEKKEQSERQEQYNTYFKVARNSIFYELVNLNTDSRVLVPAVWIRTVDPAIMQCENMALVVDCGLQTQETSAILSNLKDEVGFRLKGAVQEKQILHSKQTSHLTSFKKADQQWHIFKIAGGKFYIDGDIIIDLSANEFSGESTPFTIGSIIDSLVCMGMEISYINFATFQSADGDNSGCDLDFTSTHVNYYWDNRDGTATSRKDQPNQTVIWQDIDARTRTQDIVHDASGNTGWGVRLNGSNRGVSNMIPTSTSTFIIKGRFTSLRTGIMGSWDPELKAHYYFGIDNGKWCFGWGESPNRDYYPTQLETTADTDIHKFEIKDSQFLVDDDVVVDRSDIRHLNEDADGFKSDSVEFLFKNLVENARDANMDISSIELTKFENASGTVVSSIVFDIQNDDSWTEATGDDTIAKLTSDAGSYEIEFTPSTSSSSMRVGEQLISDNTQGSIVHIAGDDVQGTTILKARYNSGIIIHGKFLNTANVLIGSRDISNRQSNFCFGIINGKWAFEFGAPIINESETIVNPTTSITSYGSVWVTESEFEQIMAKRKQSIMDSMFVDYYDLYLEQRTRIVQLTAQIAEYKRMLMAIHVSDLNDIESKYLTLKLVKYANLRAAVEGVNTRVVAIKDAIIEDTVLADAQTEAQKLTSEPTNCTIDLGDYPNAEDL